MPLYPNFMVDNKSDDVISGMNMLELLIGTIYKHRKELQLIIGILIAILIATTSLEAQVSKSFIYGTVYTSNAKYTGQIRWGSEEAFWYEHFNVSKTDNNFKRKRKSDDDSWRNIDWRISSIWDDQATTTHQLVIQFGDIKSLRPLKGTNIELELKNGDKMVLSGEGYNDVGNTVQIADKELDIIKIKWENIDKIEFQETPKNLNSAFGEPLYGRLTTLRKGDFEGWIQWDHDEHLTPEKLDGTTRDGKVSIEFGNIKTIESLGRQCDVILHSGRKFTVSGSNDVNQENRGIYVQSDQVGIIDIPWVEFEKVEFLDPPKNVMGFKDYTAPKGLQGKVTKYRGGTVQGKIVLDLDEALEVEILDGKDGLIAYKIPLRNVKKIAPKNASYSLVTLKNGDQLLLGDARDVSAQNGGVLVITGDANGGDEYIEWRNITKIDFD